MSCGGGEPSQLHVGITKISSHKLFFDRVVSLDHLHYSHGFDHFKGFKGVGRLQTRWLSLFPVKLYEVIMASRHVLFMRN